MLAVLGVADADLLFGAVDAGRRRRPARGAARGGRLAETGPTRASSTATSRRHLRQLLVVQTLGEVPETLRVTAEQDARLAEQAAQIAGGDVVRLLDGLAAALTAVKDGADPRTQLELALVKAAEPRVDPSTRALLARIERLEQRLAGAPA